MSTDGKRLVVSVGNRRAFVYAATSSHSGESAVRDLVGHPPRWSQQYRADGSPLAVEGAAFAAGSYDVAFLSEGREILYFSRASYES